MTVEELIKELQKIEDKTLDVRLEAEKIDENNWVERVWVYTTSQRGYELHGEVVLEGAREYGDYFGYPLNNNK